MTEIEKCGSAERGALALQALRRAVQKAHENGEALVLTDEQLALHRARARSLELEHRSVKVAEITKLHLAGGG